MESIEIFEDCDEQIESEDKVWNRIDLMERKEKV